MNDGGPPAHKKYQAGRTAFSENKASCAESGAHLHVHNLARRHSHFVRFGDWNQKQCGCAQPTGWRGSGPISAMDRQKVPTNEPFDFSGFYYNYLFYKYYHYYYYRAG